MVTDLRRLSGFIPPGIRQVHEVGGIFMLDVLENEPISQTRDVLRVSRASI